MVLEWEGPDHYVLGNLERRNFSCQVGGSVQQRRAEERHSAGVRAVWSSQSAIGPGRICAVRLGYFRVGSFRDMLGTPADGMLVSYPTMRRLGARLSGLLSFAHCTRTHKESLACVVLGQESGCRFFNVSELHGLCCSLATAETGARLHTLVIFTSADKVRLACRAEFCDCDFYR